MNEAQKALKALNDLKNCLQAYYTMENVPSIDKNLNIIEKTLKSLEIKEKKDFKTWNK